MTRSPQRRIDEGQAANTGRLFSVIVPAHNEEAVIGRCLRSIYAGAPIGRMPEVIVAANGCSDQTIERAIEAAPDAIILDLENASKVAAINQANAIATHVPRLIMDADVEASFASLSATADALLQEGILAASPRMELRLADCSAAVKSYYKVWLSLPYASDGLIGGGVYGLSEEGLQRVTPLPNVIGDDLYVRTRFKRSERANISQDDAGSDVRVTMTPPTTAGQLIGIEARRRLGKHEVDRDYPTEQSGTINRWQDLAGSLSNGANVFDLCIYVAIKLIAFCRFRLSLRQGKRDWTRDSSSRKG